jgi:hypothetical protein
MLFQATVNQARMTPRRTKRRRSSTDAVTTAAVGARIVGQRGQRSRAVGDLFRRVSYGAHL